LHADSIHYLSSVPKHRWSSISCLQPSYTIV
jgi:hypothetical protein